MKRLLIYLKSNNMENLTILLSWFSLLVSILLAIYTWYNNLRLKKLENDLDIKKNKTLLNDKRSREIFDDFIDVFLSYLSIPWTKKINDHKIKEILIKVKKLVLIYWSGRLISSFNNFQKVSNSDIEGDSYVLNLYNALDDLLVALRSEIWVDNNNLEKYWVIQLFVTDNINNEINKLWKK